MTVHEVRKKALPILKRYRVRRAGVFGSVARGEDRKRSDVDILVDLPPKSSLLDLSGLKIDLEERLKRKVDVVTYDSLYHLLRDRVLREEVSIL